MPPANQPKVMSEAVFHKNFGGTCFICNVCLLTVHLGIILVNDQLDAQFFFSYMFIPSLYSCAHHQEN